MPTSTAEATWNGRLRDGDGTVTVGSGVLDAPYTFASRFQRGAGDGNTNPEELIGAAEAGCFSMATAVALEEAGYEPDRVHTEATVHLEEVDGEFTITTIELTASGTVPDATEAEFREIADDAKDNCPVSRALAGTDIELTTRLTD
jgi:osmotically inducible protein OsmC